MRREESVCLSSSSTPVPVWKTDEQRQKYSHVSARKLANALWEINKQKSQISCEYHETNTKASDRYKVNTRMLLLTNHQHHGHNKKSDLTSNKNGFMEEEIEIHSCCCFSRSPIMRKKNCLKELHDSFTTSKELLKIFIRFCGLGEQNATVVSLASAICTQLNQVRVHVDQLTKEHGNDYIDIICHKNHVWSKEETERRKVVAQSIMEELQTERRLRRRAERLNIRLGSELAQMKNLLIKITKELDNERKTRHITEKICSEMVKGIGQDKAEVEELKKESAKVLEELEEERQMLQLADEWREERVHMKLSEANIQFEEKNAAVDKLRNELERYLVAKRIVEGDMENKHQSQQIYLNLSSRLNDSFEIGRENGGEGGQKDAFEIDSEDSDLQSIELNMDNNNKSYVWDYATENIDRVELGIDKENHKSMTDCFDRVPRNFSGESGIIDELHEQLFEELMDKNKLMEHDSQKLVDNAELSDPIKEHRDQNLDGSKIVLSCGLPSPIRQWEKWHASKYKGHQQGEGSKVAELMKAIREGESKAALLRSRNEVNHQPPTSPVA